MLFKTRVVSLLIKWTTCEMHSTRIWGVSELELVKLGQYQLCVYVSIQFFYFNDECGGQGCLKCMPGVVSKEEKILNSSLQSVWSILIWCCRCFSIKSLKFEKTSRASDFADNGNIQVNLLKSSRIER